MTMKEYEDRKLSLERMKELHKNDPYVMSYLIDIERNWDAWACNSTGSVQEATDAYFASSIMDRKVTTYFGEL